MLTAYDGHWNDQLITKHLEPDSGYFYYVNHATGETYWDAPAGLAVAVRPPTPPEAEVWAKQEWQRLESQERQERREYIAKLMNDRRAAAAARATALCQAQDNSVISLWADAERRALGRKGAYSLSWHSLKTVPASLAEWPARHPTFPLTSLMLVGLDLEEVPAEIGSRLRSLTYLSLSSNKLTSIPDSFCELTNLTELILVRNRLKKLPNRIGALSQLRGLELASNHITELPTTFGNLTKLTRIVLDCNKLRTLPETLGRLRCTSLNLNRNRLSSLPACLAAMPCLKFLSVDNNGLKALPSSIGDCRVLETLRACSNRLVQLPDGICQLPKLRKLWLDYNFISGLPSGFHKLETLEEMSLEGNINMVYPAPEILTQGPAAVRAWCKQRFKDRVHARSHSIVLTIQDILLQIDKFKVAPPTFFQAGTRLKDNDGNLGDPHYAIIWEELWSTWLPALERLWGEGGAESRGHVTSFAYTREEVEEVLRDYRDPSGRVMRKEVVMFTRCGCVDPTTGRRRVCIPPRLGWMCERKATLIRQDIVLERELAERARQRQEVMDVNFRVELAKKVVREYAESEEGKAYYQELAIKKAEEIMKAKAEGKVNNELEGLMGERFKVIDAKYDKEKAKVEKKREERVRDIRSKAKEMEADCMDLVGWALEQKEKEVDALMERARKPPEDALLADIEARRATERAEVEAGAAQQSAKKTKKIKLTKVGRNDREFLDLVEELLVDGVNRDAEKEGQRAQAQAMDEHATLRRVMGMWAGLGMRDTFAVWKVWTAERIKHRRREAHAKLRQDWLDYEAASVAMTMAEWSKSRWLEHWDEYHDLPYWIHCMTGEMRLSDNPPTVEEYIPVGYVPPIPPSRRIEDLSDSESSDNYSSSSESEESSTVGGEHHSDSSSDAESSFDSMLAQKALEGTKDADAPLLLLGEADNTLLLEQGNEHQTHGSGKSKNDQLVKFSETNALAVLQFTDDGGMVAYGDTYGNQTHEIVPFDGSPSGILAFEQTIRAVKETASTEAESAVARTQRLRSGFLAKTKKEATKRAEKARKEKESGGLKQEEIDAAAAAAGGLNKVMEMVGFDETRNYTLKERSAMAEQAYLLAEAGGLNLNKSLEKYGTKPSRTLL